MHPLGIASEQDYQHQLAKKTDLTEAEFQSLQPPKLEVFPSPAHSFRMRAEFKVWYDKESNRAYYAMHEPGVANKPVIISEFTIGSQLIQDLMPRLLEKINASEILLRKLFQAEFLTTTTGESLITLIYHKPLDSNWREAAEHLATSLQCEIIGRSRKQKETIGRDFVTEEMSVAGRTFRYQQVETGFTQPNAAVCEKMLNWAVDASAGLGGDLLELYCGNGNFTLPLAENFNKVLATEISKTSVNSALLNIRENGVNNVAIARMSSEEFTQALNRERAFRRLKEIDLDSYDFSTLFVDPPRAGLDEETEALAARFNNILYISCNPVTLKQNLQCLSATHKIAKFALFDQFPYTEHRECGVLLQRKS